MCEKKQLFNIFVLLFNYLWRTDEPLNKVRERYSDSSRFAESNGVIGARHLDTSYRDVSDTLHLSSVGQANTTPARYLFSCSVRHLVDLVWITSRVPWNPGPLAFISVLSSVTSLHTIPWALRIEALILYTRNGVSEFFLCYLL